MLLPCIHEDLPGQISTRVVLLNAAKGCLGIGNWGRRWVKRNLANISAGFRIFLWSGQDKVR